MTNLARLALLATITASYGCALEAGVPDPSPPSDSDSEFDGDGDGDESGGPAAAIDAEPLVPAPPVPPEPPPPPTGDFEWSLGRGGPASDIGYGLAVDATGDLALVGSYFLSFDMGGGTLHTLSGFDALNATLNASGHHMWSRGYGGPGNHHAYAVAIGPDGSRVLTGTFTGSINVGTGPVASQGSWDIFVAKIDANGEPRWLRRLGGPGADAGLGVAVTHQGEIAVVGERDGDAYVAMLSPAGELSWSRGLGGPGADAAQGVAISASGAIAVAGVLAGPASFGNTELGSAGKRDGFVAAFTPAGDVLWTQALGGPADDEAIAVAFDRTGGLLVAGTFAEAIELGGDVEVSHGGSDAFVVRYDAAGALTWAQAIGGEGDDDAAALAVDAAGEVVLAASFRGTVHAGGAALTSAGEQDILVARYGSAGEHLWSHRFGGPSNDFPTAVAVRADGGVLVTGAYQGRVDFGGGRHEHAGGHDLFVLSLAR